MCESLHCLKCGSMHHSTQHCDDLRTIEEIGASEMKHQNQRENAVPCINVDCPSWDDKFTMNCAKQISGEVYATICDDYETEYAEDRLSNEELARAIDRANNSAGQSSELQKLWFKHLETLLTIQKLRAERSEG